MPGRRILIDSPSEGEYGASPGMRMDARLTECLAPVSDSLAEFEIAFHASLADGTGLQSVVAEHLMATRGKRMRPALVLLAHRSVAPGSPPAVGAAVAIELIHTATLLHDDVIDVSDQRRGRLSVNARWNNLTAVLMGDHLFARAFGVLVELKNHRLLEAVSLATRRVAVGELQQLQQVRNVDLQEHEYLRIIADKTASLFGASAEAGLLNAQPDSSAAEMYREFGETLGMSFQIVDDLLDYVGNTPQTGKTLGNDLKEGKITLPLIHALRSAPATARREIVAALRDYTPEGFEAVRKFVDHHGGFAYAREKADQFTDHALDLLRTFSESLYQQALKKLVEYSVDRNG